MKLPCVLFFVIQLLCLFGFAQATQSQEILSKPEEQASPALRQSLSQVYDKERTPDYYFSEARRLILAKDYEGATQSYLVGLFFGLFDSKRVQDKTAHQVIIVLRMNLLSDLELAPMKATSYWNDKPKSMSGICQEALQLGPPTYYPSYMINHGMVVVGKTLAKKAGKPVAEQSDLVEPFDSPQAWVQSLKECGCP